MGAVASLKARHGAFARRWADLMIGGGGREPMRAMIATLAMLKTETAWRTSRQHA
jgi:hypothetical protein